MIGEKKDLKIKEKRLYRKNHFSLFTLTCGTLFFVSNLSRKENAIIAKNVNRCGMEYRNGYPKDMLWKKTIDPWQLERVDD